MKISRGLSIAGLTLSLVSLVIGIVGLSLSATGIARTSKKRRIK